MSTQDNKKEDKPPLTSAVDPATSTEAKVEVLTADVAVDLWWNHISRNTPLSRSTTAFNYVQGKLPELKALLKGEVN